MPSTECRIEGDPSVGIPERLRRRRLRIILPLMAALVLYVAWTAWRIRVFDSSSGESADCAVVLGAVTREGKPSPVFLERIRHGVLLYEEGRVQKLLMTGGTAEGEPVTLAEAARDAAVAMGVPSEDIVLEPYSRITRENIAYAKALMGENDLRTCLIVSDALHMRRAMRMARGAGLRAWPSATRTSAMATEGIEMSFWRREVWFYIQYVWITRFLPVPPLSEMRAAHPGRAGEMTS